VFAGPYFWSLNTLIHQAPIYEDLSEWDSNMLGTSLRGRGVKKNLTHCIKLINKSTTATAIQHESFPP
jgi:hypothetical protein